VRRDIEKVQAALKKILEAPRPWGTTYENKEAEKLDRAISASNDVARYVNSVDEFLVDVGRGKIKVVSMTEEQIRRFSFTTHQLPYGLGRYMGCKLARIMGPQPLFPDVGR